MALLDEANARQERTETEEKKSAADGLTVERLNRFFSFARNPVTGPKRGEALKKAGLDEKTFRGLVLLSTEYMRHRVGADLEAKSLEEAKARLARSKTQANRSTFDERLVKHYEENLAAFARFQEDFGQKYGVHVPGLLDQFRRQFEELYARTEPQPAPAKPAAAPATPKPAPAGGK